jgi:hypothetical protein
MGWSFGTPSDVKTDATILESAIQYPDELAPAVQRRAQPVDAVVA